MPKHGLQRALAGERRFLGPGGGQVRGQPLYLRAVAVAAAAGVHTVVHLGVQDVQDLPAQGPRHVGAGAELRRDVRPGHGLQHVGQQPQAARGLQVLGPPAQRKSSNWERFTRGTSLAAATLVLVVGLVPSSPSGTTTAVV